jgi:hypothetical protein
MPGLNLGTFKTIEAAHERYTQRGATKVYTAAAINDIDTLAALLKTPAGLQQIDQPTPDYGDTPLHAATKAGNLEALKLLLEHKADVEKPDKSGDPPLQMLFSSLDLSIETVEIARYLLKMTKDINQVNSEGNTLLHKAVAPSSIILLGLLDEDLEGMDQISNDMWIKVMLAQPEGEFELKYGLVKLLIEAGIDVNIQNNQGQAADAFLCYLIKVCMQAKEEYQAKRQIVTLPIKEILGDKEKLSDPHLAALSDIYFQLEESLPQEEEQLGKLKAKIDEMHSLLSLMSSSPSCTIM